MRRRRFGTWLLPLTWVMSGSIARADDTKRVCVAASTLGQTLRDEGKLMDAREQLLRCSREDCPGVVKAYCAEWLADIETQTPSMVVRVVDSAGNDRTDVRTSVDGRAIKLDGKPFSLDPGEHTVSVETPEGTRKDQKVLIVVREKSRIVTIQIAGSGASEPSDAIAKPAAELSPAPAAKSGIPTGALVVGGIGVAALGSALYFGLSARSQYEDLKSCSPRCNPADTDAGHQKAVIADVSLAVGVAAVAGGVLWAVLAPKSDRGAHATSIRFDVRPGVAHRSADGFVATIGGAF